MKKLTAALLAVFTMASFAAAAADAEPSVSEAKHAAVFCGTSGHEDMDPGYGAWLKGRLDRARAASIGDAVSLGVMKVIFCDVPTNRAAAVADASTRAKKD